MANDNFHTDGHVVTLPRIGKVRMCEALRFEGKVTGATVSRTADRWFVAIRVEVDLPVVRCESQARTVGVDLGVSRLATLSDGTVITGPKPLRSSLKRLARLNRCLHRRLPGSRNRNKMAVRVARCHARISDIRGDALHKLTTRLVRTYGCVVIEDLNIGGMVRNGKLSRAISDRSWRVSAPAFVQGGAVADEDGGGGSLVPVKPVVRGMRQAARRAGVERPDLQVRRMRSRRGSWRACGTQSGTIPWACGESRRLLSLSKGDI